MDCVLCITVMKGVESYTCSISVTHRNGNIRRRNIITLCQGGSSISLAECCNRLFAAVAKNSKRKSCQSDRVLNFGQIFFLKILFKLPVVK